jgi:hypothetical protein
MGEVPLEFLSDLVGELAARYRQAVPSPVQYMNLPHLMVNIWQCDRFFGGHTWRELTFAGYPGNLKCGQLRLIGGLMENQETYHQATRNSSRGTLQHRIVPTVQSRKSLVERISHIYPWTTIHAEANGLQRFEVPLFPSMIVIPLWHPDPVKWEDCNWGCGWGRLCRFPK